MKCRICGARLASTGDICTNCYNELMEDKKLEKDTEVLYTLKRKYSIKNVVLRFLVVLLACAFMALYSLASGLILEAFIAVIVYMIFLGIVLFIDKNLAKGTTLKFYTTKLEYDFNSPIFNNHKVIKYEDVRSINPMQNWAQKKTGLGDLIIYAEAPVVLSYFKGAYMKNIENIDGVMDDLRKLFGIEKNTKNKRRK